MSASDFHDEIDAICDRFEQAWHAQPSGPAAGEYVPAGLDHSKVHRLLVELICIDMEYRWRMADLAWDSGDGLPIQPLLEDYIIRYPELGELEKLPLPLIAAEYRIRQSHDDGPNASDYGKRFPRRGDALVRRLRAIAAEMGPAAVRCYRSGREVFSLPLSGELEIGRQGEGEPLPYALSGRSAVPKLIVAPLADRRVSRTQLFLAHEAVGRILVENRSAHVSVKLSTHGRLDRGTGKHFDLPVLLYLPDQQVRVKAARR